MIGTDIAIDLGTSRFKVYLDGKGIVVSEPSIIAVDNLTDEVIAVGSDAYDKMCIRDSTTDVTGVISLPEGTEMCMPGDNVVMDVELITPIAIEEGLRFAIREGGRTVGSGVVTAINA